SHNTTTTQLYTLSLHDALPIYTYSENYRLFTNKSTASFTKSSSVWSSFSSIYFIHSIKFSLTITPMVRSMADLEADNCVITSLRSEEHTSELQSRFDLVCRLLL